MTTYPEEFKAKIIAQMLPPHNCNGQVKPDTFLGSLAVKFLFKFQRCSVTQF